MNKKYQHLLEDERNDNIFQCKFRYVEKGPYIF